MTSPNNANSSPDSPRVSVIVPSYKTAAYIGESLESVFAQTLKDFEVIVVNDDSPDTEELERVLTPYMDRIQYFRRPHAGLAGSRNFGITQARGKYISFLDSDDILEPDYLKVLAGMLDADPTLDIVYPNAVMFGLPEIEGMKYMDMYPWEGEPGFLSIARHQCRVFGLVTARREALVRAGFYDPNMPSCEDYDLWLRAIKTGSRMGYTRQVLVRYRRHGKSLSANHFVILENVIYSLTKIRNAFTLTAEEQSGLDEKLKEIQATLALYEGKRAVLRREYDVAIRKLALSNEYFHSTKTTAAIAMLKVIPGVLRMMFDYQNRSVTFPISE